MRFTRIKLTKEGKVNLEYQEEPAKGAAEEWDDYTMVCSDTPLESFEATLRSLEPHFLDLCELPGSLAKRLKVTGVSISWAGPEKTMGAVLIGRLELVKSSGCICINTPHRTETFYSGGEDGDPGQLLPTECVQILKKLFIEAKKYLSGERLQTKMNFSTGKEGRHGRERKAGNQDGARGTGEAHPHQKQPSGGKPEKP